jgi:hypothetical protein
MKEKETPGTQRQKEKISEKAGGEKVGPKTKKEFSVLRSSRKLKTEN